jgi:predicted PurR-regulated permease PerM
VKEKPSYVALLTVAWTFFLLAMYHLLLRPHSGTEDFFILVFLALVMALITEPIVLWLKRVVSKPMEK